VRRQPTKAIEAEADRISRRGQPVEFGKTELRVRRSFQSLELPVQKSTSPFTLRRGRRTRLNEIAVGIEENGIDQSIDQRKIAPRHFTIDEIEQLVFLDRSPDAAAGLMTAFGRIDRCVTVAGVQRPIVKEPVARAVNVVGSATGRRVDDTT